MISREEWEGMKHQEAHFLYTQLYALIAELRGKIDTLNEQNYELERRIEQLELRTE